MPALSAILQARLADPAGLPGPPQIEGVGGGSINETYRVCYGDKTFFCKVNSATKFPHLFHCEKSGLQILAQQGLIQAPAVMDCFEGEGRQFLLLEWITSGERTETFWKRFGEQLAALHHVSGAYHGLEENNYMGSVPQQNTSHPSWSSFFAKERLHPMVERCTARKLLQQHHHNGFENIIQKLPLLFNEEPPSLLHGDLWSGNFMCNEASEPVLIDPAVYFGHRSMDLAMTKLFGGFSRSFYESYQHHYPLPANYEEQWQVCNLYPLLIHLYLFGSSYLPQIESTLRRFT